VIAFVGSVFSPYYRRAQRRGRARADDHCAVNVCLYGPGANRWAMTERGHLDVRRSRHGFAVGPSALQWHADGLDIAVDEVANPLPRRVRGRVRVLPQGLSRGVHALDAAGRHRWGPIAPCARVEVAFEQPALRWSGHAYLDSNEGDEPIDAGFSTWDWLRAPLPGGGSAVVYDVRARAGGAERLLGLRFAPDGSETPLALPARRALPATGWRIDRAVRCDDGGVPSVARTLEDTPFYARSLVRTRLGGHDVEAVHETLSAARFAAPWVQALLPWRMPRRRLV
jgi:carotenoid 1,2-hydratase